MLNTNLSLDLTELRAARVGLGHRHRSIDALETLTALLRAHRSELYSWRRKLARAAEKCTPPVLDVYGRGWRGERAPGDATATRDRAYLCATGAAQVNLQGLRANRDWALEKRALISAYRFTIATENYRGNLGYISEKIIDPLLAGCVPVYLGDERITSIVPESAFVDVRRFRTLPRLLAYLEKCPEVEWQQMRAAGAAWLQAGGAQPFSGASFAAAATRTLEELLP